MTFDSMLKGLLLLFYPFSAPPYQFFSITRFKGMARRWVGKLPTKDSAAA
jgi:hypothetical protein